MWGKVMLFIGVGYLMIILAVPLVFVFGRFIGIGIIVIGGLYLFYITAKDDDDFQKARRRDWDD